MKFSAPDGGDVCILLHPPGRLPDHQGSAQFWPCPHGHKGCTLYTFEATFALLPRQGPA